MLYVDERAALIIEPSALLSRIYRLSENFATIAEQPGQSCMILGTVIRNFSNLGANWARIEVLIDAGSIKPATFDAAGYIHIYILPAEVVGKDNSVLLLNSFCPTWKKTTGIKQCSR